MKFETVEDLIVFFTEVILSIETSNMEVNNISFSNNSAKAYGKWTSIYDYIKMIIPIEFDLEKINDNWFISAMHFGKESEEYLGTEYEDFVKGKHNAYVSFIVGEKKYVFHDHYGGTDVSTDYGGDSLTIYAENYLTGNDFSIQFEMISSSVKSAILILDGKNYYSYSESSALTSDISFADGLITGHFSGTFTYTEGIETIEIKEGFLYVK